MIKQTNCKSSKKTTNILFFFFLSHPQNFQSKTNYYLHRVSPRRGQVLAQEILFKVRIARLKLGSTPRQAQYKHLETKSLTNSTKPWYTTNILILYWIKFISIYCDTRTILDLLTENSRKLDPTP